MSDVNAPKARFSHTAVWTGEEMIVWGGMGDEILDPWGYLIGEIFNDGARYNPKTDTWTPITMENAPFARYMHSAVWAPEIGKMIIWGGWGCYEVCPSTSFFCHCNDGAMYDPKTDIWTPISVENTPEQRFGHTAVWTGEEMVIWGGANYADWKGSLNTGGRYNPETDKWTPTSMENPPCHREYHTAIWTGEEMIVWGGYAGTTLCCGETYTCCCLDDFYKSGSKYDPKTDIWISTSEENIPYGHFAHTAVWSPEREEMIVWGGWHPSVEVGYLDTGLIYDLKTDIWGDEIPPPAPSEVGKIAGTATVQNGSITVPINPPFTLTEDLDGAFFTPSVNYSKEDDMFYQNCYKLEFKAPNGTLRLYKDFDESDPPPYFCERKNILDFYKTHGPGQYSYVLSESTDPKCDGYAVLYQDATYISGMYVAQAPTRRRFHTAAWTGKEMLIWGGEHNIGDPFPEYGGIYNPETGGWKLIPPDAEAPGRTHHTMLWTGKEMIVWGGGTVAPLDQFNCYDTVWLGDGAIYTPPPAGCGASGTDMNCDGCVDELIEFSYSFGSFYGDNWHNNDADFNCDGIVDGTDLSVFINDFGAGCF